MARPRKAAPSTDRAPFGLELEAMSDPFLRHIAAIYKLPPERARLRKALADEARIARELSRMSRPALLLLERVVDAEGDLGLSPLLGLATKRLGLTVAQVDSALDLLEQAALIARIERTYRDGREERYVALFDVTAEAIAERVRGLSLPIPPAASEPEGFDVTLRDQVALLASVVHLPMRVTQMDGVHRGSAKRLAALVGWDPDRVASLLDDAIAQSILGRREDTFAPLLPQLRELAAGERTLHSVGEDLDVIEALPPDRWVSEEALARALVTQDVRRYRVVYSHSAQHLGGPQAHENAARLIQRLSLPRCEVAGHVFLRRPRPREGSGHGDGHVTPSFEVMLGPAADPSLVVTLALATEPSRFDLVLTRKITPASINAACAAGLDGASILEALGRVGKHGVPDNVRAMVDEWARKTKTARIREVWALEASSPEAADAIVRALGADVVGRPSPTVVLVDRAVASPGPRLQKAGVQSTALVEPIVPEADDDGPDDPWMDARPRLLLTATGDPALRARVRDGGVDGGVDGGTDEGAAVAPTDSTLFARLAKQIDELPADAHAARAFLEVLERLWEPAIVDYAAWAERLAPAARAEAVLVANVTPWALLPWLIRAPRKRARLCSQGKNVTELVQAAGALGTRDGITTLGLDALHLSAEPDVVRLVTGIGHPRRGASGSTSAPSEPAARDGEPGEAGPTPPSAQELPTQHPDDVKSAFARAARASEPVWLLVQSKGRGEQVIALLPERVVERGKDVALLGIELDGEQNRSFPLATVLAVHPF